MITICKLSFVGIDETYHTETEIIIANPQVKILQHYEDGFAEVRISSKRKWVMVTSCAELPNDNFDVDTCEPNVEEDVYLACKVKWSIDGVEFKGTGYECACALREIGKH